MTKVLAVMLGAALGGGARYLIGSAILQRSGGRFPWGTVIVNITGCFVIGIVATLTGPEGRYLVGASARQFVMVGLCGGYTTFSAFGLQTLLLAQDGEWLRAGANILLSVVLCLLAVWLGHLAGVAVNHMETA
jgi:CrcB protein